MKRKEKRSLILRLIHANKKIEQSEINRQMTEHYKNVESSRKNVSLILSQLKKDGLVYSKQLKNDDRGYILKNIWYPR